MHRTSICRRRERLLQVTITKGKGNFRQSRHVLQHISGFGRAIAHLLEFRPQASLGDPPTGGRIELD